ncbi:conserved protein, unknown function, partial [Hepatocystis sp. ex Piliocolobus tephrosceles]
TIKEKMLYVVSLEEIIKENFEELKDNVVKVNDLRNRVNYFKAQIFDINRKHEKCSCKPSRDILEEDIKHLEEELH